MCLWLDLELPLSFGAVSTSENRVHNALLRFRIGKQIMQNVADGRCSLGCTWNFIRFVVPPSVHSPAIRSSRISLSRESLDASPTFVCLCIPLLRQIFIS